VLHRISRIGLATALGASVLVAGGVAVPAQAKTVNACVKKSTGELRILTGSKTKCKKGWKKISWNKKGATGPQGNQGAQGPNLMVKDGTGRVLGKLLGLFPAGYALMMVEVDGGSYMYAPNGTVYPFGASSPSFKTNTCGGTGYVKASSPQYTQLVIGSVGGPTRIVYRKTEPTYGAVFAWAFTANTEVVNQVLYQFNATGACVADAAVYNGTVVALQQVPAPLDVPGPLTIG
jgi:hypothetical protein